VFVVAEAIGCDGFEDRITIQASDRVSAAIEKSLDRYCSGIRLSSQRSH
jgi:2-methylaconitate cis-trans-isomerase PrpF